jgi:hypothetical protein
MTFLLGGLFAKFAVIVALDATTFARYDRQWPDTSFARLVAGMQYNDMALLDQQLRCHFTIGGACDENTCR